MLANAKGDGPCRKMCIANFISCWKACTRATRAVIYKQQLYALVLQTAVHWTPYEPYGNGTEIRLGSRDSLPGLFLAFSHRSSSDEGV